MTPYYDHDGITIYHGDCREVLPTLGPVETCITDPPYGINHSSSHGASWANTTIAGDQDTIARDWLVEWLGGLPAAIFGTWKVAPPRGVRTCLVWDKGPAFGMGDLAMPWKPSFELIWIFGNGWTGRRDEGVLRGHLVISWESQGRTHPNEKPVSLMKTLMQKAPGGTVLDPFMGSGTTLVAAKDMHRRAIGVEIEERYCEIAARRLAQGVLPFAGKEVPCES